MRIPSKRERHFAIAISRESITSHDLYLEATPFFAQTMADILTVLKFELLPSHAEIIRLIPDFDGFTYRAENRWLPAAKGSMISCYDAYHHALHSLIATKFRIRLPGRPRITLLNECMGLGLGIYLPASLAATYRFNWRSDDFIEKLAKNSRRLGQPFSKNFKEAIRDPFNAYKNTVIEAYKLNTLLLQILNADDKQKKVKFVQLNRRLMGSKYAPYFWDGVVPMPAIFVAGHCGFRSSRTDVKQANQCLKLIKTARSMEDLLTKLDCRKLTGETK